MAKKSNSRRSKHHQKITYSERYEFYLQENFYHDKQGEIYTLFDEYHVNLLDNIDHPALIE